MHDRLPWGHMDGDPPAPLKFDRRLSERRAARGVLAAQLGSGPRFGRIADLALVDESAGGLRAVSRDPIEPGTSIWLTCGTAASRPRRGLVVRCTPCGDGYQIGMRYELAMAA